MKGRPTPARGILRSALVLVILLDITRTETAHLGPSSRPGSISDRPGYDPRNHILNGFNSAGASDDALLESKESNEIGPVIQETTPEGPMDIAELERRLRKYQADRIAEELVRHRARASLPQPAEPHSAPGLNPARRTSTAVPHRVVRPPPIVIRHTATRHELPSIIRLEAEIERRGGAGGVRAGSAGGDWVFDGHSAEGDNSTN
jgi:hypothetical protein